MTDSDSREFDIDFAHVERAMPDPQPMTDYLDKIIALGFASGEAQRLFNDATRGAVAALKTFGAAARPKLSISGRGTAKSKRKRRAARKASKRSRRRNR